MAADEEWLWDREQGYRPLARYASRAALRGLGLAERDANKTLAAAAQVGSVRDAVRSLTGLLYERLRSRGYPYAAPFQYHNSVQRLRDPGAIHQDSGTCLDLSLLFAAMCSAAGLRAFVVVLEDHEVEGDHALVLVDMASAPAGIGEPGQQGRSGREAPVRPESAAGTPGVRRITPGQDPVTLAADGLAVEVTAACGASSTDFAEACRRGAEAITDRGYRRVHLVDVRECQKAVGEAPAPAQRPAIYPSLPPMPPFTSYPSRKKALAELIGETGTVVILGDAGTGKSMLAHHVAATVDHGCGWFLDASSEQALTTALAAAEATGTGRAAQAADGPEERSLAALALRRLHEAAGRWAVVLDNANGDPGKLKSVPRPDPAKGQLLIITTTNEKWATGRRPPVVLPGLPADEVAGQIDAADIPFEAIGGRPLLVDASRRLHEATGRWWWSGLPGTDRLTAQDAPAAFWAAAARELGGGPGMIVAHAMSWLPPVRIPVDALNTAATGEDARALVARLGRLGLVDTAADGVAMHRLFRTAVRESPLRQDESGQVSVVTRLLSDERSRDVMRSAADLDTARAMGGLLEAAPDKDRAFPGLYELGSVFERHGTAVDSASWYAKFAEWAGWRAEAEAPGADVPPGLLLRVVYAVVGMARASMREISGPRDDHLRPLIDESIRSMREAEERCRDRGRARDGEDDHEYARASSHAKAMRGLLLRKRASLEPDGSPVGLGYLLQAEQALRQSYEERRELEDPASSLALDRSQYNLAGLEVRLAQRDKPANAADHLREAYTHYEQVLTTRRRRYRTDDLEDVVACINGLAIADYCRAYLLAGTWQGKTALLRAAHRRASEAVAIRERLAGPTDDLNTSKSLGLQAKITLARLRVIEAAGKRGDRAEATIDAHRKEIGQLLDQHETGDE